MRAPTLEKVRRDGVNLYQHARAVIVIDDECKVIEIKNHVRGSLVNVLAILGPTVVKGIRVERSVRAEVGFGRAAPYQQAERKIEGQRKRIYVTKRYVSNPLTEKEEEKLLLTICAVIQKIIDTEIMPWKRVTYVKSRHSDAVTYANGRFITVPSNLPVLSFLCLARDMETRTSGHLREFAARTRNKLEKVHYATYSPKQLRQIKAVQYIAANLQEAEYGEHVLEILRKKIGSPRAKSRALFDQILDVYDLWSDNEKDKNYLALKEQFEGKEHNLLQAFKLDVATLQKRVKLRERRKKPQYRHGHGCIRFEVKPSTAAIEEHTRKTEREMLAAA